MLSWKFFSNVDACRTEAHISDDAGRLVAVMYEDARGWQMMTEQNAEEKGQLEEVIERVKQDLSRYVNRKGIDPPRGLTMVGLALWLMAKQDGTAMGRPIG